MLVMGIDPGLLSIGWGFVEVGRTIKFIDSGSANISAKLDMSHKLESLHKIVSERVQIYKPDEVAIEKTLVNVNARASLSLCHAKGAIMLSLILNNANVFEYCPTEIKKAVTGKGNADKLHVAKMLGLMFQDVQFSSNHAADALAIAVTHSFRCMAGVKT